MSVNNLDNILWTEKYRPKNLAELIVPQRIKKIFDGGVVQSMLLHGTAVSERHRRQRQFASSSTIMYYISTVQIPMVLILSEILSLTLR